MLQIGTVEQGPFRKALPPVPRSEPYPAQPGNHGAMPHEPQVKPRGEGTGRSRKGKKRTVKKLDYNAWVARQLEEVSFVLSIQLRYQAIFTAHPLLLYAFIFDSVCKLAHSFFFFLGLQECEKVERKRARDQFLMAHADHWSLREQGIDVDARPEMSLRGVPSWSIGIDISMATVERERFDPRPLDYPDL